MMSRQHRGGEIVEPSMARFAQVALSRPLPIIVAVADHHGTVAVRAAHAIRPAMLTYKLEALPAYQPIDPLTPFGRLMQNRVQRAGNWIDASDHAGADGRR